MHRRLPTLATASWPTPDWHPPAVLPAEAIEAIRRGEFALPPVERDPTCGMARARLAGDHPFEGNERDFDPQRHDLAWQRALAVQEGRWKGKDGFELAVAGALRRRDVAVAAETRA